MLHRPVFFLSAMKKIVLLLLPLLLLTACRNEKRPADVMSHEQMVAFLTDAYLLEGFYAIETQYRYDALTPEVLHSYDSILDVHGLTREDVERSLDYYTDHLDDYQIIHEQVVASLEERRDSQEIK